MNKLTISTKFRCCENIPLKKLNWDLYNSDGIYQDFYLMRCNKCFSSYIVNRKGIDFKKIYSTGTYTKKTKKINCVFEYLLNFEDNLIIDYLLKHKLNIKSFKLLDIGSGNGRFLNNLLQRGIYNSYGLEKYRTDNYGLKNQIINCELLNFNSKTHYDVITLIQVLEHVEKPELYIKKIYSLLSKNGIFLLEVPNAQSLQALISKGSWFHLDPPRHLSNFSFKKINFFLKKHGFRIIKMKTFSFKLGLFGMVQSLLNIFGFKKQLLYLTLRKIDISKNKLQIILMLFSLVAIIPLALFLELASTFFNRGGVIRIYAFKI